MGESTAQDILGRMLEGGFTSPDLKLVTSTRTFNVHKSVLCDSCPFFKAACDPAWNEGQTGVIELPEDEATVLELLKHIYGIRVWIDQHSCDEEHCFESGNIECWLLGFRTMIAANKYQLNSFSASIKDHVLCKFSKGTRHDFDVKLGLWLYQEDRREALPADIVKKVLRNIAFEMGTILKCPESWTKLNTSPELLKDVMRWIAMRSDAVYDDTAWEEPEYLKD